MDSPQLKTARVSPAKSNTLLYVVGAVLGVHVFIMFMSAPLLRVVVTLVSWGIRKKTEGRKQQLIQLMTEEEEKSGDDKRSSSSEEWEKIQATEEETPKKKGGKITKEWNRSWDGIVGFFHPFWYGRPGFAFLIFGTILTVPH